MPVVATPVSTVSSVCVTPADCVTPSEKDARSEREEGRPAIWGRPSRWSVLAARHGYAIPSTSRWEGPAGTYRVTVETRARQLLLVLHLQGSRNSSASQTSGVTSWGTSVTRVTYVVVK
jgi:hypothetical protein